MLGDDQDIGDTDDSGRIYIFHLLHRQHLGADGTDVCDTSDDRKYDQQLAYTPSKHGHDEEGHEDIGKREQDICQTHDDSVYSPAKIARNQSQRDTYGAGQQRTYNADKEGDTASVNKRAENIPSLTVGTENKPGVTSRLPCRRFVGICEGKRGYIIGVLRSKQRPRKRAMNSTSTIESPYRRIADGLRL